MGEPDDLMQGYAGNLALKQIQKEGLIVAFASYHAVNTLATVDFKLPA